MLGSAKEWGHISNKSVDDFTQFQGICTISAESPGAGAGTSLTNGRQDTQVSALLTAALTIGLTENRSMALQTLLKITT